MVKQNQGKVLVCAPSNIAVDQLTEKITATGVKVVRMAARSRESISTNVDYLSLHEQIRHLKKGQYAKMNDLIKLKEEQGELSEKDQAKLKELKMNAEDEILRGADVICTTCATAFDRRLRTIKFR